LGLLPFGRKYFNEEATKNGNAAVRSFFLHATNLMDARTYPHFPFIFDMNIFSVMNSMIHQAAWLPFFCRARLVDGE